MLGSYNAQVNATDLGFTPIATNAWTRDIRGTSVVFRSLSRLDELLPVEAIQRDVFGAVDLDIYAAGQLMSFAEAGGHTLTAWINGELAGAVIGIGGITGGEPRILSDWMGVYPRFRSHGIGADLKRLQAAVSLSAGYQEIFWTVDPLRAANARLNFNKLGAFSDHYEENRYGTSYGQALYGGLPSDRLHLRWRIADPAVQATLMSPATTSSPADVPEFKSGIEADVVLIEIPNDIDAVLASDQARALEWRMAVRSTLPVALGEGFQVTGFLADVDTSRGVSALLLTRGES
jgi:predicted GNAT superfamily acetyltransferase